MVEFVRFHFKAVVSDMLAGYSSIYILPVPPSAPAPAPRETISIDINHY